MKNDIDYMLSVMQAYKEVKTNFYQIFIYGYVHSKYKFGLYYNGELVSLMTFGKSRPILNAGRDNKTCELYE